MQAATRFFGVAQRIWLIRSLCICFLFAIALPASALVMQEVRWGFDGQVVPGRFNLLSVLVANPSSQPFDGMVQLYKNRGLENRVGAVYGSPCYLSPLSTRWLQFYVYVDNQYDEWRLEWGRGPEDRHNLEPPKWSSPAQVLLSGSETIFNSAGVFKQFPEELFPSTVAATSGLDSVLLDHAPRWEPAKRRAFLDWLSAGGKVHLLLGADNRYPVFSDELSILNFPEERLRIGAGLVSRHAATVRDLRKQDLQDDATPWREFKKNEPVMSMQTTDSFLRALARMSQRKYNWSAIYLLTIAYLALAGPGNFFAGRKIADYRLRILLLLGTITVFGVMFNFIGRRGLGETNMVHTLSYARSIGGNNYDVMQWVNVFAARGSHYTVTHDAPHNLYSTGLDYESVNGVIESGRNGRFMVDIPMFSRRAFLHEAEMKGDNIPIKVISWNGDQTLRHLELSVGADFGKEILTGWLVHGNSVYTLKATKNGLEFSDSDKSAVSTLLDAFPQPFFSPRENNLIDVKEQFQDLAKPLLAWSLNLKDFNQSNASAKNRAQLFLFTRSPQSFAIAGSELGHETGCVLYSFDVFKPGTE